ncbi:MAG: 50S ribosomal protein L17 [Dehalococcoidia bacterium]|nr:50S ribosomal protein L17 [Dehalococcoidia bacterium]
MRHRVDNHKLGRNTSQRMSIYKSIVSGLIRYDKVTTTESKAKRARVFAEKMITLGKQGTLHSRRQALSFVGDEKLVEKVFAELAPKYAERHGGYTRMTKLGPRQGDAAPLALLELVE